MTSKTPSTDRLLRRLIQRGIVRFAGGAGLIGGLAAAPVLLACSCPSWTEWHVRTLPEQHVTSEELDEETCKELCHGQAISCRYGRTIPEGARLQAVGRHSIPDGYEEPGPEGEPVVICEVKVTQPCSIGRRPEGLRDARIAGRSALGTQLAQAAHLEAAAVVAFLELAFELEAHGAPEALVAAAQRAALDEVRHADTMGRLARMHGHPPVVPTATLGQPRSLEAVIRTNRVEGMVDEAYGAAVAAVQAKRAATPLFREVMGTIAREENRHANLARAIHGWGTPKLARSVRTQLEDEGGAARERLAAELADESPTPELGMPSATEAQAMVLALG